MVKSLCITQDSKSENSWPMVSGGVWTGRPLWSLGSGMRLGRWEPRQREQQWAGSKALVLASCAPLGKPADLSGLPLSHLGTLRDQ